MPDDSNTTENVTPLLVQPVVATPAIATPTPVATELPQKEPVVVVPNVAVTSVLQWLTYSFWGWAVVTIGYLVALISSYTLNNSYESISPVTIPSAVAAAVILLVIAAVTVHFYSKRETEHKTGIAMVLMVIHAVLFGLLAVGSLIVIAFGLIQLLVGSSSGVIGSQVAIITASTLFVTYVLILIRVVRPYIFSKFRIVFKSIFVLLVAVLTVLAITGPVVQTIKTKNDRAVTTALVSLESSMQQFVTSEKRLPKDLNELLESDSTRASSSQTVPIADLVKDERITYSPNELVAQTFLSSRTTKEYTYQLCGVFDYAAQDTRSSSSYYSYNKSTRVDAGKYCQTLDATSYQSLNSY